MIVYSIAFTPTHSEDSGNVSDDGVKNEGTSKQSVEAEEDDDKLEELEVLSEASYHRESSPELEDIVVMPNTPAKTPAVCGFHLFDCIC